MSIYLTGRLLHKFVISFNDTTGNVISSTVYVTVWNDLNPPIILNKPVNIVYTVGRTSNTASWVVIDDLEPGTYTLLRNGTIFNTGVWFNDTELTISVDGFSIGSYNLTILFSDQSGNTVAYTFWVYVIAPLTSSSSSQTSTSQQTISKIPESASSAIVKRSNTTSTSGNTITQTASLNMFVILFSFVVLLAKRRRN